MREHDDESVRGLPGPLPAGETMLWQGAPDWRALARAAFHVRGVAVYFVLLSLVGLASGSPIGAAGTLGAGAFCIALLYGLAWLSSRTTVYTLTDRRLVFKIGIALPKCLNLPLVLIDSVDLRALPANRGDIALAMGSDFKLGYLLLWPHARPWHLRRPSPMLRALPDAEAIAARIASACAARAPAAAKAAAPAPARMREATRPLVAAA